MKNRTVTHKVQGQRTQDGAGVNLVRVLGHDTVAAFDPILMLDSFDSTHPDDYTAGFPMHPHRGIETISYLYRGNMVHKDTLGNVESIGDGEVQWMTAGSGIEHEEQVPAAERLLGVQLWLNLPRQHKMTQPHYHSIKRTDIPEIAIEGGKLRLLAGRYLQHTGYLSSYLPLDYYDIHLAPQATFHLETAYDASVMIFTLLGEVWVGETHIAEKTAAKLSAGDSLTLHTKTANAQILLMNSQALNEPVAWAGPIVMNSREELREAFSDLQRGTFIKDAMSID